MNALWQDIAYGCRWLARKPGFTVAAILSLALGIGANTTIFSIINGTILSSLPYREPQRLAILWSIPLNRPNARGSVTAQNYLAWQKYAKSFSAIGGVYGLPAALGSGRDGSPAEQVEREQFTPSVWDTLGVKPMLGRVFQTGEDQVGSPAPVVVLSYDFWQSHFGGKPEAVGQKLEIDGEENTVIGVMPKGFRFDSDETAFWSPLGFLPQQLSSAASFLVVPGRLRDGASLAQAQAEMASIAAALRESAPERNRGRTIRVESIQDAFFAGYKQPLYVLQGAVAFVLLIACANVAGLLLARGPARRTEVAVRSALGAGRLRVVRQLLTESLLLAAAGGILGVGLGWVGLRLIRVSLAPGTIPPGVTTDFRVLGFTALVSILTGLLFGTAPALETSKVDLATSLKESGRSGMDGTGKQRVRSAMVAAQIGLALILLIGTGLMIGSFVKLRSNSLGLDPANVLTFEFRFTQAQLMRPVGQFRGVGLWEIFPATGLTYQRVYERMKAIPGVVSAAAISRAPASGSWMNMPFRIEGQPAPDPSTPGGSAMTAAYFAITPDYFSAMKIPVLSGRDVASTDTASAPPVVVINQAMADRWFPGQNPIGQQIALDFVPDEPVREIVGVVGNTLAGRFQQRPQPTVFVPFLQQTEHWQGPSWDYRAMMVFVLRTAGDPNHMIRAVQAAVADVDPSKPANNIQTVEQYLDNQLRETRTFMALLGIFGAVAALLAAIGIYGVMAFAVAQRTREIGIRVALGATSTNVLRLIIRQALLLILAGMVLGLAGAYGLTRFLQNLLWNVSPTDPATFTVMALGLIAVAIVACLAPTRRAARVDPMVALRYE